MRGYVEGARQLQDLGARRLDGTLRQLLQPLHPDMRISSPVRDRHRAVHAPNLQRRLGGKDALHWSEEGTLKEALQANTRPRVRKR